MIVATSRIELKARLDLVAQFARLFLVLAMLGFSIGSAFGRYGNTGAYYAAGAAAVLMVVHTIRKPTWIRAMVGETVDDARKAEMNRVKSLLGKMPKGDSYDGSVLLNQTAYGALALGFSDMLVFPFVWLIILSCLLSVGRECRKAQSVYRRLSFFWFVSWTCSTVCWLNMSGNTRFSAWEMAALVAHFVYCAGYEAWLLRGDLKRLPIAKAQIELLGVLGAAATKKSIENSRPS